MSITKGLSTTLVYYHLHTCWGWFCTTFNEGWGLLCRCRELGIGFLFHCSIFISFWSWWNSLQYDEVPNLKSRYLVFDPTGLKEIYINESWILVNKSRSRHAAHVVYSLRWSVRSLLGCLIKAINIAHAAIFLSRPTALVYAEVCKLVTCIQSRKRSGFSHFFNVLAIIDNTIHTPIETIEQSILHYHHIKELLISNLNIIIRHFV